MKLIIASMSHETNSFSPVPTPLSQFGQGQGPSTGQAAVEAFGTTGTPVGAFITLAQRRGDEFVVPIIARCSPSAPVDDDAFEAISESICKAVEYGADALLLDLHGAMVTQSLDDGEGELLARIRRLAPDLPIGVSLDFHANISPSLVSDCNICVGYKTYPHVDMYETGARVAELLFHAITGGIKPVMAFGSAPMLPHTLRMDTSQQPMQGLVEAAAAMEQRPGILAASVFGGFPLADTPCAGLSCLVVADGDPAAAEAARDEVLAQAWQNREGLVYAAEALEQSIGRASEHQTGPILLIDHADNCNSGGTLDSMAVVEEVLRQGLRNVAVAPICDPDVARQLHEAGVGATVTVELGEKSSVGPAFRGKPLRLTGRVAALSDGRLTVQGPVMTGTPINMGPSAVLQSEGIEYVVTSRRIEPYDQGVFTSLGIDPLSKAYLLLKSRIQYKPAFLPIAAAVIECDGRGVASSDYSLFDFKKVRRPIFPLDRETRFPV